MVFFARGSRMNGGARSKKRLAKRARKNRPSKRRSRLLIQARENLRIAHIGPFTGQFERFNYPSRSVLAGLGEFANRVGQFVFAAGRRFQFRREIENARPK